MPRSLIEQHRHPFGSCKTSVCSVGVAESEVEEVSLILLLSISAVSPNSLRMTAMRFPWDSVRIWERKVDFPEPRKPVIIVKGTSFWGEEGGRSVGISSESESSDDIVVVRGRTRERLVRICRRRFYGSTGQLDAFSVPSNSNLAGGTFRDRYPLISNE